MKIEHTARAEDALKDLVVVVLRARGRDLAISDRRPVAAGGGGILEEALNRLRKQEGDDKERPEDREDPALVEAKKLEHGCLP